MRLHALTLHNFRQHASTHVQFTGGLTGIIGANGAGKTTLLEAIAWALYGNSAARGTRDSIRHARADDKAPVRVTLDFELGGHRYRVDRSLRTASVYMDGGAEPIAHTIRGANELLQRRMGMSRSEFFNTYFTGQKELDVMAALGPVERARFLARVLGYDRLGAAQEMLRDQRRSIIAELTGLRSGMPDASDVARKESEAEHALAAARDQAELSSASLATVRSTLNALVPRWEAAERARERWRVLDADRRVVMQEAESSARDVERLQLELASVETARSALAPLLADTARLDELQQRVEQLDALSSAESERQGLSERLRTLQEEQTRLDERLGKLDTAPAFELEQRESLARLRDALLAVERELDDTRTLWARDRQEAETKFATLETQREDLAAQHASLDGLGAESPCPTCGRPLGASYRDVLALLTEQLETVTVDSGYFRQRARQLAKAPEAVQALDARRTAMQQDVTTAERRYARIQAALQEREQLGPQRESLQSRMAEAQARHAALPVGYSADEHRAARSELKRVAEMAARAASLQSTVNREPALQQQRDAAAHRATERAAQLEAISREQSSLGFDDVAHESLRAEHALAAAQLRSAELADADARGSVQRTEQQRDAARVAREALGKLQRRADALEVERSLHDELDDEFGALRDELNDRLRPELSELASAFLESLTDGRYAALELDENYGVQVLEDGLPKAVLSGGEEDLCNLVLRLAISQMIAERAGQPFSLLILDEVFGSLDESRRDNVLALLRRLHDRFEQVIVITHIEDVREGLDRVLSVSYDPEQGTSRVAASLGGAAGADAASWEAELV